MNNVLIRAYFLFMAIAAMAGPCAAQLRFSGRSFFAITVSNADSTAEWYKEVFDLKNLKQIDDPANSVVVRICGNKNFLIEILTLKDSRTYSDCGLSADQGNVFVQGFAKAGFYVDDLKAAEKYFLSKNIKLKHGPFSDNDIRASSFIIEDPHGNLLQFFEELH